MVMYGQWSLPGRRFFWEIQQMLRTKSFSVCQCMRTCPPAVYYLHVACFPTYLLGNACQSITYACLLSCLLACFCTSVFVNIQYTDIHVCPSVCLSVCRSFDQFRLSFCLSHWLLDQVKLCICICMPSFVSICQAVSICLRFNACNTCPCL